MEAFLSDLLPRILPAQPSWRIINHGSKWQLLKRVPERLGGYARMPSRYRPKSLILVDRDDADCRQLKATLEAACQAAGLRSKTSAPGGDFDVVNRIVIEELEAWYFGDIEAVAAGWPGVPARTARQAAFRDPDAIAGGTHEAFLALLRRSGHLKGAARLPKIDAARRMGGLMNPGRNRSGSFHHFLTGLQVLSESG